MLQMSMCGYVVHMHCDCLFDVIWGLFPEIMSLVSCVFLPIGLNLTCITYDIDNCNHVLIINKPKIFVENLIELFFFINVSQIDNNIELYLNQEKGSSDFGYGHPPLQQIGRHSIPAIVSGKILISSGDGHTWMKLMQYSLSFINYHNIPKRERTRYNTSATGMVKAKGRTPPTTHFILQVFSPVKAIICMGSTKIAA
jgi:hypothetical protein